MSLISMLQKGITGLEELHPDLFIAYTTESEQETQNPIPKIRISNGGKRMIFKDPSKRSISSVSDESLGLGLESTKRHT